MFKQANSQIETGLRDGVLSSSWFFCFKLFGIKWHVAVGDFPLKRWRNLTPMESLHLGEGPCWWPNQPQPFRPGAADYLLASIELQFEAIVTAGSHTNGNRNVTFNANLTSRMPGQSPKCCEEEEQPQSFCSLHHGYWATIDPTQHYFGQIHFQSGHDPSTNNISIPHSWPRGGLVYLGALRSVVRHFGVVSCAISPSLHMPPQCHGLIFSPKPTLCSIQYCSHSPPSCSSARDSLDQEFP